MTAGRSDGRMSAMEKRCSAIKRRRRGPRAHFSQRTAASPHADPGIGVLIKNWEALRSGRTYPLFIDTGRRTALSFNSFVRRREDRRITLWMTINICPSMGVGGKKSDNAFCMDWGEESCKVEGADTKRKVFFFPIRVCDKKKKRTSERTGKYFLSTGWSLFVLKLRVWLADQWRSSDGECTAAASHRLAKPRLKGAETRSRPHRNLPVANLKQIRPVS